ncbi:MAG: XTP/dITP diphosphatase [Candidatus Omnitrophota bacterium]
MRLIVATRNKDKLKEIKALLKGIPLDVVSLGSFSGVPEVIEDGKTLEANATKKAKETSSFLNTLVIADDSGLEVRHLGNQPGVYSARFSGKDATYTSNNKKLLDMLEGVSVSKRKARFRCCIAIADKGKIIKVVEGKVIGKIVYKPKGRSGFGYDPVFIPDGYKKTYAELGIKEKNKISHRGKALLKVKKALMEYLSRC